MSKVFSQAIDDLSRNDGITDRRMTEHQTESKVFPIKENCKKTDKGFDS
jgi:hypothetical protein